jgi:hypothetical protein
LRTPTSLESITTLNSSNGKVPQRQHGGVQPLALAGRGRQPPDVQPLSVCPLGGDADVLEEVAGGGLADLEAGHLGAVAELAHQGVRRQSELALVVAQAAERAVGQYPAEVEGHRRDRDGRVGHGITPAVTAKNRHGE